MLGDAAQGADQVRVVDASPRAVQLAVRIEVDAPARLAVAQAIIGVDAAGDVAADPESVDVGADDEAGLGVGDGRGHHVGPGHGAVLRLGFGIGLEAAGDGDGLVAHVVAAVPEDEAEAVAHLPHNLVGPHLGGGGGGGAAVEVDAGVDASLRQIELHAAEAGDAGHLGVHHALHEGAGDGGVDGVAAVTQDDGAGLHRFRLGRHDHAAGHSGPSSHPGRVARDDAARERRSPCTGIKRPSKRIPSKRRKWSGREDLNLRPLRPERSALPDCATPRPAGRVWPAARGNKGPGRLA